MSTLAKSVKIASVNDFTTTFAKKQVQIPGSESNVLVSKIKDKFYVTSPKCTHYGAPLEKGVLTPDGTIRCPWHGACFKVTSGDVEDAPALDALQSFPVEIKDGDIYINADSNKLSHQKRVPCQKVSISSKEHIVIVGGGSGGMSAAQTLRTHGFAGKVTMITSEGYLPIDRTRLSKALITDPSKILLREESFFKEFSIDVVYDKVTGVSSNGNKVTMEKRGDLEYTTLILSTGGSPRSLPMPGFDSSNVYMLRSVPQAKAIVDATSSGNPKIVVLGSSWIGLEISLALKGKDITCVGMEQTPVETILGPEVGRAIQSIHEANGVKFKLGASIKGSKTENSKVTHIELKDGTLIPADVVIMAVGVAPQTSYLKDFSLEKDGSVQVDSYLRVKGFKNIFACGDIATFPFKNGAANGDGHLTRVEHWDVAMNHGQIAARNAMGHKIEFEKIPIFWSAQGGQLRYAGHPTTLKYDTIIKGNLKEKAFLAYYAEGDKITAVAGMGMDPVPMKAAALFAAGMFPSRKEIEDGLDILQIEMA